MLFRQQGRSRADFVRIVFDQKALARHFLRRTWMHLHCAEAEAKKLEADTGINLAAIDFIFDFSQPDPEPLFLEINYVFGRRGLGGSMNFYHLLSEALQQWLAEHGFDPQCVAPL